MATHNSQTPYESINHPCPIKQILETKKATCTRHIHLKPDGTEVVVNVNASPLFDEKGKVEYIAESYIEVTDGH